MYLSGKFYVSKLILKINSLKRLKISWTFDFRALKGLFDISIYG